MNPYVSILSSRFSMLLQYRAAAFAGIVTQFFFGLVRMMIFEAFYASTTAPQPLSHDEVVTYIWLVQAMLLLVMFGVDSDVALMIRSGTVAYEMTRPLDLYNVWFVRAFSGRLAPMSMRAFPIFIGAGLFFGLKAPASWTAALGFALSIFTGLLLSASIVTLLTISMLWTVSGDGISRMAPPLIFFFSGALVPLPLLPDFMQPLSQALPFRGLIDTPFRIYLGQLTGAAAGAALLHQVFWIAALMLTGRLILRSGVRRLVVQGG